MKVEITLPMWVCETVRVIASPAGASLAVMTVDERGMSGDQRSEQNKTQTHGVDHHLVHLVHLVHRS